MIAQISLIVVIYIAILSKLPWQKSTTESFVLLQSLIEWLFSEIRTRAVQIFR